MPFRSDRIQRLSAQLAVTVAMTVICSAQNTIRVPADRATIQAAILSAANGDTILVSAGTYRERIDFSKKAVTVKSVSGPDFTTIDGGGQTGAVISFGQGEGLTSVLQGFTIQNGKGDEGGGITVQGSSPSILSNRIVNNTSCGGGGIGVGFGSPLIQGNIIANNSSNNCGSLGGGGILFRGASTGRVLNNTITGNSISGDGGGISLWAGGAVTVRDNVIYGNTATGTGGGLSTVNSAPAVIVGNLFVGNKAGGVGGLTFSNPPASLINNTIADNQSTNNGAPISGIQLNFDSNVRIVGNVIAGFPGQTAVACGTFGPSGIKGTFRNNDVVTPGGAAYLTGCVDQTGANGNISMDPRFINSGSSNYRLQSSSPAIGAGDATASELGATDLDANPRFRNGKVDMGAYEYPGPTNATLSTPSLTFSVQAIGTSSAVQAITIQNTGSAPMQISSIAINGDFSQTSTCSTTTGVAPGANCIVAVTFAPVARGIRTGTLTIVSNANSSPQIVALSGTGIGAAVTLSTAILTFPNQTVNTDSAAQQLTVTNTGDSPLTITSVAASAEFSQTNTCAAAVAPSATCSIAVTFHPIASGTRTGTIIINSNAVGSPQVVNVVGNGQALAPGLVSISPASVSTFGAAFTLTVQGSNFIANSVVRWNGSDRPTSFSSTTQLTAMIASSDLTNGGSFPITVFNPAPGGGSSSAVNLTVMNLVPSLTSISPTSALVGGSSFQLTVNGSNFVAGSVVRWNGNDRATTFVSPGQLRAAISATDISFASTSQVTVFNPAPGGGTSGSLTFTALVPTPLPSLTSISPTSATAGDPGFTLTVAGAGFVPTSVVQWNRSPRPTTFISDSQLQAAISNADIAFGGSVPVTVSNPAPGGGISASVTFSIAGSAFPSVTSVSPATIAGGGAAFTLTVTGFGFSALSVVRWNGGDRPTTFVNPNQLTAAIAASDTAALGTVKVTVFNPPPGGGTSQPFSVTIAPNPAPVVSSLIPATLVVGTASQAVQIRGSGFSNTSVVRWNGQDRQSTMVDSSTLSVLLRNEDLAAPGISEVRVFNPPLGGGSSGPVWFATTVGVAANSLAYDKTRGLLYASVPSSQTRLGNSVVSIDPVSGAIGQPIFVGSEPGKLVISDDGQYLYVSLTTAAAVRRVDLVAQIADLQFALGSDGFFGATYVDDMAVMPGNAHAIAVSRKYLGVSPRHAGVAIFDDGVMRKKTTQVHTGSDRIEWSSSPTTIYGYNNETTEFGFRILKVDADGVTEATVFGSTPFGGFGADIKYDNGRIYGTSGSIVNPDSGTLIGTFNFTNGGAIGLAPDSTLGRSFFSIGSFGNSTAGISVYDNSTFTPIGNVNIPGLNTSNTFGADDVLVRWGEDGLAMRSSGQVVVFRSAMVKPATVSSDSIVNSATFAPGPVAPGSIVSLFGTGFTSLSLGATGTPLPQSLAGVGVIANGSAVPLFFASPGQINFQVPWELTDKPNADLSVAAPGFNEKSVKLNLTPYSPGIFTLGAPGGQAVAVIAGTSSLAAPVGTLPGSRPANRGEYITVYCNGLGPVMNQPATGTVSPTDPPATTTTQPKVTIGGQFANVTYAGLAPGLVGVYQLNIQIPALPTTGDSVPLALMIGGAPSNTATIAVR
jgi:uncharacterized protein (TIGR03437 family)